MQQIAIKGREETDFDSIRIYEIILLHNNNSANWAYTCLIKKLEN